MMSGMGIFRTTIHVAPLEARRRAPRCRARDTLLLHREKRRGAYRSNLVASVSPTVPTQNRNIHLISSALRSRMET